MHLSAMKWYTGMDIIMFPKHSRNLLNCGIELLKFKVEISKMSTDSGIELPHSWIACALARCGGTGNWLPWWVYHKLIINKFVKFEGTDSWIWSTCCLTAHCQITNIRLVRPWHKIEQSHTQSWDIYLIRPDHSSFHQCFAILDLGNIQQKC